MKDISMAGTMTNEERVKKLLHDLDGCEGLYLEYERESVPLILAYADELRRECAEKAEKWYYDTIASAELIELERYLIELRLRQITSLKAAIMGKEADGKNPDCSLCENACRVDITNDRISLWCDYKKEQRTYTEQSYCHKYHAAIMGKE